MLVAGFIALALAAFSVNAEVVNAPRNSPPGGDVTILNYALTLEYLEAAFYAGALKRFSARDFQRAGYPAWVRNRVEQLSADEDTHVAFLSGALGAAATKPCTYNFPYRTVDEFLALSRALEGVGVSAYLGAAGNIVVADYLTAAGAILTVEARHSAVISEVEGSTGFPNAFDTPLGFSEVYTLAANYIVECPKSNPALPVTQFPSLRIRTKNPQPGHAVQFKFDLKGQSDLKLHVLSGLNDFVVPITNNGVAEIPAGLTGRIYFIVTNSDKLADNTVVAGPTFIDVTPKNTIPSFQKWTKPAHGHHGHGHKSHHGHWHHE